MTEPAASIQESRGFTLVEVLISLGIVAVLASLVYGSFGPAWEAKTIVEEEADRYQGIRLSLDRMAREISMAFLSEHFDRKRFRERPSHFVSDDSSEDDKLRFTMLGHERLYLDAKESDQSVVEYKIGRNPDERDKQALLRREKTVIDDDPDDGGTEVVLAEDVEGLDFQFWDVKKKEWVSEWDTADVERAHHLPQRVKIVLIAKGDNGKTRKFTTQAKVFLPYPLGS